MNPEILTFASSWEGQQKSQIQQMGPFRVGYKYYKEIKQEKVAENGAWQGLWAGKVSLALRARKAKRQRDERTAHEGDTNDPKMKNSLVSVSRKGKG